MKMFLYFILMLILLAAPCAAQSQQPGSAQPDLPVDAAAKSQVIDQLLKDLEEAYVFPETAKKMAADVKQRQANKEYDAITSSRDFVKKLTDDLQGISKDKHLRVRFSYEKIPVRQDRREPSQAEIDEQKMFNRRLNYGFDKVERLDGNIGYINLRGFFDPKDAVETVASAMNFISNTDALIIDLRQNGGGSPHMVALISSYLFGEERVHLNDLYFRPENKTTEFWTDPKAAAKKYGEKKDIYLLTSNRTFSAAEEFTYNLKNLKRATIIGETTGGGAHPGGMHRLNDHFGVFVPSGRAINPISKTNWEGTGVKPDVETPKEMAFKTAHMMALKKEGAKAPNEMIKKAMLEMAADLEKELEGMKAKPTAVK